MMLQAINIDITINNMVIKNINSRVIEFQSSSSDTMSFLLCNVEFVRSILRIQAFLNISAI